MRQQVNPRTLAVMVGYALRGQALPRIYYGGQDIPVRIRFEEQDRQSLAELRDFSVPSESGETHAIGTLVDVRQQPAATRISRRDKQTARRITVELEEGRGARRAGRYGRSRRRRNCPRALRGRGSCATQPRRRRGT